MRHADYSSGGDAFHDSEGDRELLYRRFTDYQPFAQAYNSPLDKPMVCSKWHIESTLHWLWRSFSSETTAESCGRLGVTNLPSIEEFVGCGEAISGFIVAVTHAFLSGFEITVDRLGYLRRYRNAVIFKSRAIDEYGRQIFSLQNQLFEKLVVKSIYFVEHVLVR